MWRERRGVPAVPSLELIGCVTGWPNPPGLMCGRPGPEWGRLNPPLWARVSAALGAGEGDPEGRATTFFIFIILPTPPALRGCLFMGHICWLAGDMSLVRMPGVPKEPGKWGTFLRTGLRALLTSSFGF